MEKKVGIASCYYQNNYGSMLQAYATQLALDRMQVKNETIDISGFSKEINRAKYVYFFRAALTSDFLKYKLGNFKNALVRKFSRGEYARQSQIRIEAFRAFREQYIRLSDRWDSKQELSNACAEIYSAVLVGSDQLWLPGNICGDFFTLNFVPEEVNSIAYATSFGQSELPRSIEHKAEFFLRRIKHIGVREEAGARLVQKMTDRRVPIVCDPTLLFTAEEWLQALSGRIPIKREEDYILCYFLGKNSLHRNFAMRLREYTGLKMIALIHLDERVLCDDYYADSTPFDIGPADFVGLVRDARYVLTDSFHCSVFSILFQKIFFTFRRYSSATKYSTNGRVENLLQQIGLSQRLLEGTEDIATVLEMEIEYNQVLDVVADIRQASYEYLQVALENERSTDL